MGVLQPTHLILILVIALILVGPGKLSSLGSALGKSVRDFKSSMGEGADDATTAKEVGKPQS